MMVTGGSDWRPKLMSHGFHTCAAQVRAFCWSRCSRHRDTGVARFVWRRISFPCSVGSRPQRRGLYNDRAGPWTAKTICISLRYVRDRPAAPGGSATATDPMQMRPCVSERREIELRSARRTSRGRVTAPVDSTLVHGASGGPHRALGVPTELSAFVDGAVRRGPDDLRVAI